MVWKQIKESRYLYVLFALPLLYFVIFKYGAMFGLLIAFQDYDVFKGIWHSRFIGLEHFREFVTDAYFWKVVRNTIVINLYMLLFYFPMPIILALMINEVRLTYFKKVVQSISYLPHFLSTVVVCGMLVNLLSTDGMINQIIAAFGGTKISFFMKPEWFRFIYVISEIWQKVGWGSIIYLAALSGIDPHLYEASRMDGANRFKQIWHISLPGIAPVISILFLLTLGELLSVGFEKILLLYTGPTYETADVISTYIYRRGLIGADFSYGTAVGLFQSVLALFLVYGANRGARKLGSTSLW
ncbi:ABC transporter permease [Paenibacillus sp. GXUN7292]|uniref:ABC transporter permease n=1 Tax=Paenibacillus sp. GXUN7292 TaxID=3422499 RepID=UPI003D7EC1CA